MQIKGLAFLVLDEMRRIEMCLMQETEAKGKKLDALRVGA